MTQNSAVICKALIIILLSILQYFLKQLFNFKYLHLTHTLD